MILIAVYGGKYCSGRIKTPFAVVVIRAGARTAYALKKGHMTKTG